MSVSTSHLIHSGSTPFVPVLIPLWSRTAAQFQFTDEGIVSCGSGAASQLRIGLQGIASEHGQLQYRSGLLSVIRGSGSIWVNDIPVHKSSLLEKGDILSLGPASFRVDEVIPTERRVQDRRGLLPHAVSGSQFSEASAAWHPFAAHPLATHPASVIPAPVIPASVDPVVGNTVVASAITAAPLLVIDSSSATHLQHEDLHQQCLAELNQLRAEYQNLAAQRDDQLQQNQFEIQSLRCELAQLQQQSLADEDAARQRTHDENLLRTAELNERQMVLSIREEQLREIESRWDELEQVQKELAQSVSAADTLRIHLDDRAAGLESREQRCCETAERLTGWEAQVAAASEELTSKINALAERESALNVRVAELANAEALHAERLSDLSTRDDSQQLRQILLDEREAELISEHCLVREQQEFLALRETEVSKISSDLKDEQDRLKDQQLKLQAAYNELNADQSAFQDRRRELDHQEQQIAALQEQIKVQHTHLIEELEFLNQRDQGLISRENSLQAAEELILERQESLAQLHRELAQREASLNSDRASLTELKQLLDDQIPDLTRQELYLKADGETLRDLELQLTELQASQQNRESALQTREHDVQELEQALAARSAQISQLEADIAAHQQDLHNATESLSAEKLILEQRAQSIREADAVRQQQLREHSRELAALSAARAEAARAMQNLEEQQQVCHQRTVEIELRADELALRTIHLKRVLASRTEMAAAETTRNTAAVAANLSDVTNLQVKLEQAVAEKTQLIQQHQVVVHERQSLVTALRDLQASLQQVGGEIADHEQLREQLQVNLDIQSVRITALEAELQQRDQALAELQTQQAAAAQEKQTSLINSESLVLRDRELDLRAELLDRREQEVSDKVARLQQNQDELQSQHRLMLEARQQLEQARAEIHVAMQQHSTIPPALPCSPSTAESVTRSEPAISYRQDSDRRELMGRFDDTDAAAAGIGRSEHRSYHSAGEELLCPNEKPSASVEEVTQLRSELASLFGLKDKKSPDVEENDAFLDTSLPTAEDGQTGVELKFTANSSILLRPPVAEPVSEAPANEDDSPDFVTNYMEQLLARSRKVAGGVLPNELQNKHSSIAPPLKSRPQVTSFLDQYMSGAGAIGNPDQADSSDGPLVKSPPVPRQRIDRDVLRANMDSFRTVSTQSVENALATSAMQKEQNYIIGRIAFVTLLVLLSVVQVVAMVMGAYNEPTVMWTTIVATLVVGLELARKVTGIRGRVKSVLAGAAPRASVPLPVQELPQDNSAVTANVDESSAVALITKSVDSVHQENAVATAVPTNSLSSTTQAVPVLPASKTLPGTERTSHVMAEFDDVDDRYFEL